MSTDRELLELAAKAIGVKLLWSWADADLPPRLDESFVSWSPLTEDGDALRLAVKLGISVHQNIVEIGVHTIDLTLAGVFIKESTLHELDAGEATRRAIVRAAAEIGKAMP